MSGESSPLEKAQEIDRSVFDAVAGWSSPLLDRIMPALSIAASFSRLWMAIAALFAVFGGTKGRKTAVEGMATIGVTSFLAAACEQYQGGCKPDAHGAASTRKLSALARIRHTGSAAALFLL